MYNIYLFLVRFFGFLKIFPTQLTPKQDVALLINKLKPWNIGIELIRVGPMVDGGYLLPNDIGGIEACFSPGVEEESGFEKDCSLRGMNVYMADKSVDGPATNDEKFFFTKKFIGVLNNETFMTMDEWVNASLQPGSNSDLMLQMDIEGFEYETFMSMSDNLMSRFRIIIVEFHGLEKLWSKPFFRFASATFEKILQTHSCVHIHPNNCTRPLSFQGLTIPSTMEFTFFRNDRIQEKKHAFQFPHHLDQQNTGFRNIPLPDCWYDGYL